MSHPLIGAEIEEPERIARMLDSRRRDDGGYAELDVIDRAGTNPTAAAVGLLSRPKTSLRYITYAQLLNDPLALLNCQH